MQKYEKIVFEESGNVTELPCSFHTVECPNCRYVLPVPITFIDWEEIARIYKDAYGQMMSGTSTFIRDWIFDRIREELQFGRLESARELLNFADLIVKQNPKIEQNLKIEELNLCVC